MSKSQAPRVTELKAESNAQAQAGTVETQESTWDAEKTGARNGKAAEEAAWVMNHVCIPQGKRSHSRQETKGAWGASCVLPRGCAARLGVAVPRQGAGDTPAPGGPRLRSTAQCAALGT